jgi:diadenosine tetraphosphate (Ap4A) HIT family hydrolase
MDADCPFCRKLHGPERFPPEDVVWEFAHSIAVLGPWQYYQGYCLLVSRRHAAELSQLSHAERGEFLEEMASLARAMEACFRPRKLNYELLGNQVPHLHWHLFPRYDHDPDKLKPVWIALERAEQNESERLRLTTPPGMTRAETVRVLQEHLRQPSNRSS